jgi:hypothetical protein
VVVVLALYFMLIMDRAERPDRWIGRQVYLHGCSRISELNNVLVNADGGGTNATGILPLMSVTGPVSYQFSNAGASGMSASDVL